MMYVFIDHLDVDRLLCLIGMLGSPNESDFWDSWRTSPPSRPPTTSPAPGPARVLTTEETA